MDRTVPFDKDEQCQWCGTVGAYDFMGDFLCPDCAHEALKDEEDDADMM